MSNVHQIHKQDTLGEEEKRLDDACNWLAKIDRVLSEEEKSALQTWFSLNPNNVNVLLEVAHLWDKMENLTRLSDLFPQTSVSFTKKYSTWLSTMAASIMLVICVGFYLNDFNLSFLYKNQPSVVVAMQMNYQTGVGESNTISLPDNSKIVLNTNSFVQVRYTASARIIDLQRGEIHIDVAHDKTRPLSVIAGGKVIQAVGTAFNVEVRNELVELIVTDGKVLVAKTHKDKEKLEPDEIGKRLPANSMAISKGEKVNLDLTGNTVETIIKINPVEVAESLSWRQGNLIFRGESLADAMAEISRYTNIEFELSSDKKLQEVQVAGMFKTGDVTGLLEVLTNNFNISYKKVGNNKIILNYVKLIGVFTSLIFRVLE
ncbi:FecR domain-containing protein [Colwellia sp. MSW7]|uniref:FecR domain-containing protein n=1 Tax=Colwellia maritima TaxID=2912588 RepID=A0ABS9WYS8_9GAMM|nr:FecR domain-containing protein [Colwellia maritima]MCI2283074.1 FecR domain-containing protein [Colwellia maritima]